MPHVSIQYFPRDLSNETKQAVADEVAAVLKKHLGSSDASISVAMSEVAQDQWKEKVYDREIGPCMDQLVRQPGYRL